MDFDKFDKILFFSILGFIVTLIYFYFIGNFLQNNFFWIFFVFLYIILFVLKDTSLKKRDYENRMRIKDRKEIRLTPYSVI